MNIGDTLQGFGLHNAGRHYTIVGMKKGRTEETTRIKVEDHLSGSTFWDWTTWYRVVMEGQNARR